MRKGCLLHAQRTHRLRPGTQIICQARGMGGGARGFRLGILDAELVEHGQPDQHHCTAAGQQPQPWVKDKDAQQK